MRSIADDVRRDSFQRVAQLSVTERIALALRLGDDDVALYRAAHGVREADARRALRRARAIGRLASCANDAESV